MSAKIQTFHLDEAIGRKVTSTRGHGVDGAKSPGLKVVQYPIDVGITEINLRFGYDQIGDGFYTPRHHHNFDQFRYVVSGAMNLGKNFDLPEGELVYVPEGTYYGPLNQKGPVSLLVIQFPGPNAAYRISDAEKQVAMDALRAAGGYFEDGIYKIKQPDGHSINKDSYEAVWEQHNGRPITYASPRYETPIIIRPQGFRWMPDPARPGVEMKNLGAFTEYGTSVALWRLAPGAVIPSEVLEAPQLRWSCAAPRLMRARRSAKRDATISLRASGQTRSKAAKERNSWSTPCPCMSAPPGRPHGSNPRRATRP